LGIARVQSTQQFGIGGQNTFCPQHHKNGGGCCKKPEIRKFLQQPFARFYICFYTGLD